MSGIQNRADKDVIWTGDVEKKYKMARNGSENPRVTRLSEKFPNTPVSFFSKILRTASRSALVNARVSHMSGCPESNWVYLVPNQAYYRYTTPRFILHSLGEEGPSSAKADFAGQSPLKDATVKSLRILAHSARESKGQSIGHPPAGGCPL